MTLIALTEADKTAIEMTAKPSGFQAYLLSRLVKQDDHWTVAKSK